MPELEYQNAEAVSETPGLSKTSGSPWPIRARFGNTELHFSGSFDSARIEREKFAKSFERILFFFLILFGMIGLACLIYEIIVGLRTNDLLFIIRRNIFNFIFVISFYTDLYLYAYTENKNLKEKSLTLLHLELHAQEKLAFDVYQLFTDDAAASWVRAYRQAPGAVTPLAIFKALAEDQYVRLVLARMRVDPKALLEELSQNVTDADPANNTNSDLVTKLPYFAFAEAINLHATKLNSIILFYAFIKNIPAGSAFANALRAYDLDTDKLEVICSWQVNILLIDDEIRNLKKYSHYKSIDTNKGFTAVPTPYLNHFSEDLTLKAKYGNLPLAIGRGDDLENIFKLFSEKTRCITIKGAPGTGRSTVIDELAYKMVSEDVPEALQDKRLVKLELAGIVGSNVSPEEVLENAFAEAERNDNIILVLEDVHLLAKATGKSGLTLLQVLTNRLQESSLMALATTTPSDFIDYLHQTTNFEQVFTTYELLPLSMHSVIQAACVKATFLEGRYKIFFSYDAIEAAVKLSGEYMKQEGEPQAAVSLLTEAATKKGNAGGQGGFITAEEIETLVSEKSHIPTQTLSTNEADKLLHLEEELGKHVIGQRAAIKAVSEAIRRSRAGLSGNTRPIGSFLFVGPTGVGKTELAKTLARVYFGDEKFFLRLDMSEYQGVGGLEKLLGDRNTADTIFVKHLKEFPFCLFLLDEFEKGSREILNLFLQILEDGRLTTTRGEVLDLSKTIIIATSNAGTQDIQTGLSAGEPLDQIKGRLFEQILVKSFPPELLNRFDDIILFAPLTPEEIFLVTKLYLQGTAAQIKKTKDIDFAFSDAAIQFISERGYNAVLGARPIRRFVQDHVETLIANAILTHNLRHGAKMTLDVINGQLDIQA